MALQLAAISFPAGEGALTHYLKDIRQFPMLGPQEEFMLAKRWREHGDRDAADKLVTSHLRLAVKIAMGYRGYGLPISELISEGNIGLMQAVKRFEPDRGFRLTTYALWWIKAAIQEYILRSWSLVKMGTTGNQKKLFFNLRKAKSKISALEEGDLRPDQVKLIAKRGGHELPPPGRRFAEYADPRGPRFRRMAGLARRRDVRSGDPAGGGGANQVSPQDPRWRLVRPEQARAAHL
jgi:RNA polymerase sigma-32 factor